MIYNDMLVKILSFHFPFVLVGESKIYKHPNAETLYLTIPAKVVQDSTFLFKKGDRVSIRYDPEKKAIIVEPINKKTKKPRKK